MWSSVLTIRALPINDGIDIGCNVIGQNFNIISRGATLIVKGICIVSIIIVYYYFII